MNPVIELIRLIAVILITFTHTRNNLENGVAYFIIEELPKYGTTILSIISGFLFYTISRKKKGLLKKKIKTLSVPYLIANLVVLSLVLLLNYFGYDSLNRLTFDTVLITDGIFSLKSPPINPPTYFIRDLFILFTLIAIFYRKEYYGLFIIIPLILFGSLVLRYDIAFMFALGIFYAKFKENIPKKTLIIISILAIFLISIFELNFLKFPISFLIFILLIDLKIKFINTGRFSYLLHLYHSPIMVMSYPILKMFINNPLVNVFCQISLAIIFVFILNIVVSKISFLKILSGGR